MITYCSAYSRPAPGRHQGLLCCRGVVLPLDSEALGVGYFFRYSGLLTHPAILHLLLLSAGGIGRGLLLLNRSIRMRAWPPWAGDVTTHPPRNPPFLFERDVCKDLDEKHAQVVRLIFPLDKSPGNFERVLLDRHCYFTAKVLQDCSTHIIQGIYKFA